MSLTPREFIKKLKEDELNGAVDADIDQYEAQTPEARSLLDLLAEECPELLHFAAATIDRMPDTTSVTEDQKTYMLMNTIIVLGAVYRVAENRDFPQIEDLDFSSALTDEQP